MCLLSMNISGTVLRPERSSISFAFSGLFSMLYSLYSAPFCLRSCFARAQKGQKLFVYISIFGIVSEG